MTSQSVAILLALFLILISCKEKSAQKQVQEKVFKVKTQRVSYQTVTLNYRTGGFLEAVYELSIRPEVSGRIIRILVEEGDTVKKGDLLAEIEDSSYRKAYEEILWELEQTQREYENQKAILERRKEFYKKELISKEEFEEIQTHAEVLKARIESLKVKLENRKLDLEKTKIKSPVEGIIAERMVNVGDYVTPQREILKVLKTSPLRFVFKVPQEIALSLKLGTPVKIKIGNQELTSRISYISPYADKNRLFTVKALISKKSPFLKAGVYGEVSFPVREIKAISLPEEAVLLSQRQSFVWVVKNSRVVKVPVEVLYHEEGRLYVKAPLKEGDKVIVEGLLFLYEGAKAVEQ